MKAKKILADGNAVVSTRGLRRVIVDGRVAVDFARPESARKILAFAKSQGVDAEVITYGEAARRGR